MEVILDPAEAARIMDVANAEGKANYSWECSLLDTQGVEVAHTRNDYQLRLSQHVRGDASPYFGYDTPSSVALTALGFYAQS
ncbi:MAG: hypothetical protein H6512_00235 [Acidimicrobiia bacterium]|nr:hypothetical protein [Acidimicrobiia bacterium]